MTVNTVTFMDKTYTPAAIEPGMPKETISLLHRTSTDLATIHNLAASNIGGIKAVNRFADNKSAVKRTWAVLVKYDEVVKAEEAGEPRVDFQEMTPEELAAQKGRGFSAEDLGQQPHTASDADRQGYADGVAERLQTIALTPADKAQVADEAKSRKPAAKRGSQAGTIRAPRAPKADDGEIRLPTEGGKQRAKRQKDGSYAFRIPATKPRTDKLSDQREELLGLLVQGDATWASIKAEFGKDDFCTVTTITMFCITLGYGLLTRPDGTIELLEPLA